MTVLNSIIQWLNTFDPKQYERMEEISTDVLEARINSFSVCKEPVINKKKYVSGKEVVTEHYTLNALLSCFDDAERALNNEWGELLERWVEEQEKEENYPQLEGKTVKHIEVTTPFCMGRTRENESIYQMTIAIKYEKEN